MQFGMIGLGRMGTGMALRLMAAGHSCCVNDVHADAVAALVAKGARGTTGLAAFVAMLDRPRVIWLMLPAAIVDRVIGDLAPQLAPGDIVIDGANSHFHDDLRRAETLRAHGLHYVDVGVSGGVWGLERGYCLMIGGEAEPVQRLAPIFSALAPGAGGIPRTPRREGRAPNVEEGWLHCGASGAGHLVKMIHNGIEYGMMQALAEGLDLLRHADSPELPPEHRLTVDVADVAEVWRRGSVITSWLLDLTAAALAEDPELTHYSGRVGDSGEGRWTVQQAVETAVSAPVLTAALFARFASRNEALFAEKALSAMRHGFGGHLEPKTSA